MRKNLIGIDIGGTKCAVIYGISSDEGIEIVDKTKFPTTQVQSTLEQILAEAEKLMHRHNLSPSNTVGVGIACGGPLDARTGTVLSPPNLPGWNNIPIVQLVEQRLGVTARLQNDANACALAEWKYGAGKGSQNMVFMTFGTGLGAGIIANGRLYSGANDNAGELGHIRLSAFGPVGYGKMGSFEGFVSGSGIAQLARAAVMEKRQAGQEVAWCPAGKEAELTAKTVAEAARQGDELALHIYNISSHYLGRGLALVVDILNPEVIVIGGIFTRNRDLMMPETLRVLRSEALPGALAACRIESAALGEQIGDYSALSIADSLIDAGE